jgi:GNAT superfamily N-acetyltransferase
MRPLVGEREAEPEDEAFAREVHHAAFREVSERQFGPWDVEAQDGFFVRGWSLAGTVIILADGVPCGYAQILDGPGEVLLGELALLPAFQGRGIGSTIVGRAMARARTRGAPLRLQVLRQSRALALYLRMGLVEVGRTPTHVLMEWRAHD